jgi:putative FmdB family regulatory protein
MPVYDWSCQNCGEVKDVFAHMDDTQTTCPKCGALMDRLFSPPSAYHMDIEPYWEENLGGEPVYVESRRHLNQLCRERGIVQKNALSHKDQRPPRWI